MRLVKTEQMQSFDSIAINDYGIPGVVLMENAGRCTAEIIGKYFGIAGGRKVVIFAGPGNNGGDGLVIARHLYQQGAEIVVYLLVSEEKIKGDALVNLNIVKKLSIPVKTAFSVEDVADEDISQARLLVDALFGTGLKRTITGHFAEIIDLINRVDLPVVAVDMPSGLDGDRGIVLGSCVEADLTATYGLAKPGQFTYPGHKYTGRLEVVDIGIPPEVVQKSPLSCELLDQTAVRGMLADRFPWGHKGSYGHLLIVAGSRGKTGAAILTVRGALRSGAGLVSLCGGIELNGIYESVLMEAMTISVAGLDNGAPGIDDYSLVKEAMANRNAVVLGPGLGQEQKTVDLIRKIYSEAERPLVIDADGLNCLSRSGGSLENVSGFSRIFTPHPGEMARLTGLSTREVQEDRMGAAREFAEANKVYLVLKGAATVVGSPDGLVAINSTGNPGLATGGTGDVLSGIIGGLLVQGLSPWQAACLGVFVHGRAGDILAERNRQGFLASEVADFLPAAFEEIKEVDS
ncbi:MAG: NAD(P)H-hydrate dehydratase [Thermodesulfobacteriota bacterium]